jgi:hypothetical protein
MEAQRVARGLCPEFNRYNAAIGIGCAAVVLGLVGVLLAQCRFHHRSAVIACSMVTGLGTISILGGCYFKRHQGHLLGAAGAPQPMEPEARQLLQWRYDELMHSIRENLTRDMKTSGAAAAGRNEAADPDAPIDLCAEARRIAQWRRTERETHPKGFPRYARFSLQLLTEIRQAMALERQLLLTQSPLDSARIDLLAQVRQETAAEV